MALGVPILKHFRVFGTKVLADWEILLTVVPEKSDLGP